MKPLKVGQLVCVTNPMPRDIRFKGYIGAILRMHPAALFHSKNNGHNYLRLSFETNSYGFYDYEVEAIENPCELLKVIYDLE